MAGFFDPDRRFTGALLLLLMFPFLLLLQVMHWMLWAVDEIAFRRYRQVNIESPVFVIGAPRTGTTFLHHVLAGDPGFTTFRLWECLFGITVSATPGPYGLLGCWWARRLGIPFVVGFHTHYSGVTDQYQNRFLRAFSRFYFNCADWLMFRCAELGARRAEVMGTLLPALSLKKPVTEIQGTIRKVIFAGRLAPEKRVHTIVEAAEALPHIQFTVAGDGPLRAEIEQAAERLANLECLGWVSRRKLLDAMDEVDLIGFEADTAFRAACCVAWNGANLFAAGRRHPVRLAIHPNDLSLRLAGRLRRLIDRGGHSVSYDLFRRKN